MRRWEEDAIKENGNGKYFHLKQIALAMQGEPLFLAPRRIVDVNFSPGIQLGTKISGFSKGSVGPAQEEARTKLNKLSATRWRNSWYGVSHKDANSDHIELGDNDSDDRLWSMLDIPTSAELELVQTFYDHWNEVVTKDSWTSDDITIIFPDVVRLNIVHTGHDENAEQQTRQPPRARSKIAKHAVVDMERRSPESEDEEVVDVERSHDDVERITEKGKGVARDAPSHNDTVSEDSMDVDTGNRQTRRTYLRREVSKAGRAELFEVPTRVDGECLAYEMIAY